MVSKASDFVVEVRDRAFKRLGQIAPEFLDLQMVEVFRGVGAWQMKLPAEHPLLADLKQKGSGIIVTERIRDSFGQVIGYSTFSGRMQTAVLSQAASDPKGTWLITGVDDNVVGAAVAVLPDPAHAADLQESDYWNYAGAGETVMKAAVQLNAGSGAIAARKYAWLTVAPDLARGSAVSASARFDKLGDLLTSLGIKSGLGWRFRQVGSNVEFDVYEPADKSAYIRLDIRNGGLQSTELGYSAPSATEALVLGQGQGVDRTVRRVTSTEAAAEALLWGLRWEVPKDQRNTDDPTELQQAGEEILTEQGMTVHSLKVTPSDAPNQRIGIDWGLGDVVTVILDDAPATATVTEVATSVTAAGVIRTATVGDPVGYDWEAKVSSRIREQETRISDLERLVDAGVTWDGVSGKPAWLSVAGVGGVVNLGTVNATTVPNAFPVGYSIGIAGSGFPTTLGEVETLFLNIHRGFQRVTNKTDGKVWQRTADNNVWTPWAVTFDPQDPLPDAWTGNGPSGAPVGSGTGWNSIGGALRHEWPARARGLWVDVQFGALGVTNTGYWMVGVSIFEQAGGAWSIPVENADPNMTGYTGSPMYGIYAPFSRSTQQVQLTGTKRVLIPAGVASVFQMAARKSVSSSTAAMNYSSMEVTPVRWA
jgi:hypothetical protein